MCARRVRTNLVAFIMFATRVPLSGCRRVLDLCFGIVFFAGVEVRWAYGNAIVHRSKSVKTAVSSCVCSSMACSVMTHHPDGSNTKRVNNCNETQRALQDSSEAPTTRIVGENHCLLIIVIYILRAGPTSVK